MMRGFRVLSLGLLLVAGAAHAGSEESARAFLDEGRRALAKNDVDAAIEKLALSHLFAPAPGVLFQLASALERAGRNHDAAVLFDRFLEVSLEPTDARARIEQDDAEKRAEANHLRAGDKGANTAVEEAKRATAAAQYAFTHKDYDTALVQYLCANAIVQNAQLVYNIAVALESLGRYRQAAIVFDRHLEIAPAPKTDDEKRKREETRARADAMRHRKETAIASAEPSVATPPPVAQSSEGDSINLIVHGPQLNDGKLARCHAAVRRAGIMVDQDAQVTAVLTLQNGKNRLQIADRAGGIARDDTLPAWGMNQLCVSAAQAAQSYLRSRH